MAPVDPMALADSEQRGVWHNTHDMKVFSFWDTTNTRPTVDIMLAPVAPRTWPTSSVCAQSCWTEEIPEFDPEREPDAWGTWEDSATLRRWSFARRTPEQRLAWLVSALQLACQSGALKPRRPDSPPSPDRLGAPGTTVR